jgi:hypothetical protein
MKQHTCIVLYKSDFADPATWYGLLETLDIPHGEETSFEEPDTIEIHTAKVETS